MNDAVALVARLRPRPHQTPRYVDNRIREILYRRAHPEAPWLTPAAIRLLATMLRPADRGISQVMAPGRS